LYHLRYDSLRKRLALPFGLLGLLIAAVLGALSYWLVADIEDNAIKRVLQTEMESFRSRKAHNPAALPPSASLIRGDFLPSAAFPSITLPASDARRFRKVWIDGRNYTVLVEDIDGRPFALLYDRTVREAGLTDLAWVFVMGTLVVGTLSALLGHILAGQVVRPIRRLLNEISEKSIAIKMGDGAPVSFSAHNYPNDEIGQLVQAIDQFALRLFGFMQRESQFAADVSHELRTPIAVIRGAAEVLVEIRELPLAARERLRMIHRQAVRAGEILEAMLLIGRESGPFGDPACAMAEVVEEAMTDCTSLLDGRPLELVVDIRERPIVAVERSLAYVVISNLLRNACSHTREGSITVRLTSDRVEIIDTGVGIPEHRFPEVFNRHVKGTESVGSGLGLSIVARITEMLRWEIGIESGAGKGTHVTVRFARPKVAATT
jgi:signal transduction histidine kinase